MNTPERIEEIFFKKNPQAEYDDLANQKYGKIALFIISSFIIGANIGIYENWGNGLRGEGLLVGGIIGAAAYIGGKIAQEDIIPHIKKTKIIRNISLFLRYQSK